MEEHQSVADICSSDELKHSSVSDLDKALKMLSCHHYVCQWTPEKSVFKLLYIFCLPELQGLLETIKFLSSRTNGVEMLCLRCIEEGEIAQLAALLLFAWDSAQPVGELLKRRLAMKHNLTKSPVVDHENMVYQMSFVPRLVDSQLFKINETSMKSAWMLLKVLESFRSVINSFRVSYCAELTTSKEKCFIWYHKFTIWRACTPKSRAVCVALEIWWESTQCLPSTEQIFVLTPDDVYSDDIPCFLPKLKQEDRDAFIKALETSKLSASHMCDEPVFLCDWESADDEEMDSSVDGTSESFGSRSDEHSFKVAISEVIKSDQRDAFLKLISTANCKGIRTRILRSLLLHDAVNCFAAVLSGETSDFFSLDDLLSECGFARHNLLHQVVGAFAIKITALLLEKGFAEYVEVEGYAFCLGQRGLPLNIALARLRGRFMRAWTGESAVELVIRFCDDRMRYLLELLRVLAREIKDIRLEFIKLLREGKILEVCALLLVAHKQLLLSARGNPLQCLEYLSTGVMKLENKVALVLLDIFGKVGDELGAYIRLKREFKLSPLRMALEVATILEGAGFAVTHKEVYVPSVSYGSAKFEKKVLRRPYYKVIVEASWRRCIARTDLTSGLLKSQSPQACFNLLVLPFGSWLNTSYLSVTESPAVGKQPFWVFGKLGLVAFLFTEIQVVLTEAI